MWRGRLENLYAALTFTCIFILIRSAFIDRRHARAPTYFNGEQYRRSEKISIVVSRYQIWSGRKGVSGKTHLNICARFARVSDWRRDAYDN